MKRWILSVAVGPAVMLLSACGPKSTIVGYYGPTQTLDQVVAAINENNRRLPTVYADVYADIYFKDGNTDRYVNATGFLMARKPREFVMRLKHDPIGTVFEIGSDATRYWANAMEPKRRHWWGTHASAANADSQQLPIRPDLVGEVLGINEVPTAFLEEPVPTMRFNNDARVYMMVWSGKLADRWFAQKEIWYDLETKLPRKVLLFDKDGRIIVRADLGEHKPVRVEGQAENSWPKMATTYDLFFPLTKAKMQLKLSGMEWTHNGRPKEGTIQYRELEDPDEVIPLDRTNPR